MNETRKKIIINELVYWKKNRLLPEHYCDYLLALYDGGEQAEEKRTHPIKDMLPAFFALFCLLLTLYVNYFTKLGFNLQMLLTIFLLFLPAVFLKKGNKQGLYFQSAMACTALIFLLLTERAADAVLPPSSNILYVLLLIHCAIWFFTGRKLNMSFFVYGSVFGALTSAFFYFFK
ncbi:hypothetical protein [Peribacillus kribbensis]|uniref:hypothetical protein n=1 Tax=Peribacillus kribbensis TaxID=356658 RepID=UPI00041E41BA|nr:hypothetical protein [Peribacillus kribbensis]